MKSITLIWKNTISRLVYIKEAKKEDNTIIHTPNEYEISLAINEAEDNEGLQYSLRRIFLATFNKDPFNY